MLLQSHNGEVHLLPALPEAWPSGQVKGLRARGGYTVDMAWEDGRLTGAIIRGGRGGTCKVRYGGKVVEVKVRSGGAVTLGGGLGTQ
jgi:alpha-L-fucosidase 2